MPNQKLNDEWTKLIQENLVPDRKEGELTLNEVCELSNMSKATIERLLAKEIKTGRITRHRAHVGNRIQFVYVIT